MTLAWMAAQLPLAHGFGINTNILETNVLNLAVVIGVVVTVVGDALRGLLDTRRQTILGTLQEAEQKAAEAQARLDQARQALETARRKATQIRTQATSVAEQEGAALAAQFSSELARLRDAARQGVQLQRQRAVQQRAQQVARLALNAAESTLVEQLVKGSARARQRDLNERHVRETFRQLNAGLSLKPNLFVFLLFCKKKKENKKKKEGCRFLLSLLVECGFGTILLVLFSFLTSVRNLFFYPNNFTW